MTATKPKTVLAAKLVPTPTSAVLTALDYAMAAVLIIATLPVLLLAMLGVKLTSRGPAVYMQTRLGRGGKVFTVFKLRTMIVDAEGLTGPRWSLPGDPRITPIGQVLRTLHIDELPQLWNVLRGEMSLVGPRPERPEIAAKLRKVVDGYDRRLSVKPGITGWAQVHLPPDETVDDVRMKLKFDLAGIRQRGVGFNVFVIACTGLKVVGLKRIYSPPMK